MKRRTILAGLLTAGGGAVIGTGAFSSVTADRQVSVSVAEDNNALLGIDVNDRYGGGTENGIEQFNLQENLFTDTGFNPAGRTILYGALAITNNGVEGQPISVRLGYKSDTVAVPEGTAVPDETHEGEFSFRAFDPDTAPDNPFDGLEYSGKPADVAAPGSIPHGGTAVFDLVVDPEGELDPDAYSVGVTISATTNVDSPETPTETPTSPSGGGAPKACPVSPNVAVSVGQNALGDQIQSSDIDLTGNNNDIDGDVITQDSSDGDIDIADTSITGRVEADAGIGTLTNTNVGGNVTANGGDIGGTITGSEIGGDVRTADGSDGDIDIDDATIAGTVEADGGIGTLKNTAVGGTVRANGGDIGDSVANSTIGGNLITAAGSDGDIDLTNSSVVCGNVTADGDIGKIDDSAVGGNVTAPGDIDILNGATVFGNVTTQTDGDVLIAKTATVRSNVSAGGDVTVNGTVEGNVSAEGSVDGSGTIEGDDPR